MDDISALMQLAGSLGNIFLTVTLCSIRLYAAFAIMPPTADELLPGASRMAVMVLLGFFIAFGQPEMDVDSLTPLQWLGLALKEMLIGLLIGFAGATVFWVAESVGAMIDMQAGYNNVQLQNPLSGQQSTPVSALLLQMTIAVFYLLGGLLVFVGVLMDSFKAWPVLSALPSMAGLSELAFLKQIDAMMGLIVKFAAPVLLVLILIDLGIGFITRAADKLEPSSLSQPIKGAVTMLMLALLAGVLITQVRQFLLPTDVLERLIPLLGKR